MFTSQSALYLHLPEINMNNPEMQTVTVTDEVIVSVILYLMKLTVLLLYVSCLIEKLQHCDAG